MVIKNCIVDGALALRFLHSQCLFAIAIGDWSMGGLDSSLVLTSNFLAKVAKQNAKIKTG